MISGRLHTVHHVTLVALVLIAISSHLRYPTEDPIVQGDAQFIADTLYRPRRLNLRIILVKNSM